MELTIKGAVLWRDDAFGYGREKLGYTGLIYRLTKVDHFSLLACRKRSKIYSYLKSLNKASI